MSWTAINKIMELAGCTEAQAVKAFNEHKDIVEAVVSILDVPYIPGNPRPREPNEVQKAFIKMRKDMEALDHSITKTNQLDSSSPKLSHTRDPVQEEKKSGSDCTRQSHQVTLAEVEQKQETACPSPSVCFCD